MEKKRDPTKPDYQEKGGLKYSLFRLKVQAFDENMSNLVCIPAKVPRTHFPTEAENKDHNPENPRKVVIRVHQKKQKQADSNRLYALTYRIPCRFHRSWTFPRPNEDHRGPNQRIHPVFQMIRSPARCPPKTRMRTIVVG